VAPWCVAVATSGHGRSCCPPADAPGLPVVSEVGDPPRDPRSPLLDFVIGPENYHPIEHPLYSVNLRGNAQERVAAYLRERAGRSRNPSGPGR
jgi:hypothetical protein